MTRTRNQQATAAFADEWARTIRKGDVIESPTGNLRVVRSISHVPEKMRHGSLRARKTHVHLAIQHCSWTHRCYTVYNVGELAQIGYRPVAARDSLRRKIDREIEREFGRDYAAVELHCCDVVGLP